MNTPQTLYVKEDTLDEVVGWMEGLTDPYNFPDGKQYFYRIDHFQIVPTGEGKYTCVVLCTELPRAR